jgi:hypothetical protein
MTRRFDVDLPESRRDDARVAEPRSAPIRARERPRALVALCALVSATRLIGMHDYPFLIWSRVERQWPFGPQAIREGFLVAAECKRRQVAEGPVR